MLQTARKIRMKSTKTFYICIVLRIMIFYSSSSHRSAFCGETPFCRGWSSDWIYSKSFGVPFFVGRFIDASSIHPFGLVHASLITSGWRTEKGTIEEYRSRFINILDERHAMCSSFINILTHPLSLWTALFHATNVQEYLVIFHYKSVLKIVWFFEILFMEKSRWQQYTTPDPFKEIKMPKGNTSQLKYK